MTASIKQIPNLRFKNFSNDSWSIKSLEEIAEVNPKTGPLNETFYYIDLESVVKGNLIKKSKISRHSAPSRAQRVLQKGDILFQTVRPYQRNHYHFKNDVLSEQVVASTGFAQLRSRYNVSDDYLYHLVNTDRFDYEVGKRCTGTSYPAINSSDLGEILVVVPELEEQQKIANFFTLLDKRIKKQWEKVELLREQKKGIIQQIFNKEIQFKYPDGSDFPSWKYEKLSNILVERKEYAKKGGEFPHASLSKEGVTLKTERFDRDFLVKSEDKKYKVSYFNDICYNPANLKFGVIGRNKLGSVIFSPIYITFEVADNFDPVFIEYFVSRNDFIQKVRKYEEGTVYERMAVKPEDLILYKDYFPCLEEQQVIADFILKFEKKISMEAEKLNSLIQQKKGFLQQMFI